MNNYEDIIRELEEARDSISDKPGNYFYKEITKIDDVTIYGHVDISTKARGIIFRYVNTGQSYYFPPGTRGFKVISQRVSNLDNYSDMIITVTGEEYNDVFTTFVMDLLEIISTIPPKEGIIPYVINHLRKWQKFMEELSHDILTENQRKGLFGELVFIYTVLIPKIGVRNAILSWVGPEKAQQDFILYDNIGIEIKTTSSKLPVSLHISSEKQLDPSGFRELFLCHYSVNKVKSDTDTLPDLVGKIFSACECDSELRMEFSRKLLAVNYRKKDEDKYLDYAYSVIDKPVYLITAAFPNITPGDLKKGVGNVTYSIQCGVLEPFRIDDELFYQKIMG